MIHRRDYRWTGLSNASDIEAKNTSQEGWGKSFKPLPFSSLLNGSIILNHFTSKLTRDNILKFISTHFQFISRHSSEELVVDGNKESCSYKTALKEMMTLPTHLLMKIFEFWFDFKLKRQLFSLEWGQLNLPQRITSLQDFLALAYKENRSDIVAVYLYLKHLPRMNRRRNSDEGNKSHNSGKLNDFNYNSMNYSVLNSFNSLNNSIHSSINNNVSTAINNNVNSLVSNVMSVDNETELQVISSSFDINDKLFDSLIKKKNMSGSTFYDDNEAISLSDELLNEVQTATAIQGNSEKPSSRSMSTEYDMNLDIEDKDLFLQIHLNHVNYCRDNDRDIVSDILMSNDRKAMLKYDNHVFSSHYLHHHNLSDSHIDDKLEQKTEYNSTTSVVNKLSCYNKPTKRSNDMSMTHDSSYHDNTTSLNPSSNPDVNSLEKHAETFGFVTPKRSAHFPIKSTVSPNIPREMSYSLTNTTSRSVSAANGHWNNPLTNHILNKSDNNAYINMSNRLEIQSNKMNEYTNKINDSMSNNINNSQASMIYDYYRRYGTNPFRLEQGMNYLKIRTHNRRRWSYVFPVEDDSTHFGKSMYCFHGPNWKSLSQPAILPLSTDFLPLRSELHANYSFNEYTVIMDEKESAFDTYENLLTEMVCQRLSYEFQLAEVDNPTEYIEFFSRDFGSSKQLNK